MGEHHKAIHWEKHDDGIDGAHQSACGRFVVMQDHTYGYLTLHHSDDTSESIAEAVRLADLTAAAERAARGMTPADLPGSMV